jgi:hypothetical protein
LFGSGQDLDPNPHLKPNKTNADLKHLIAKKGFNYLTNYLKKNWPRQETKKKSDAQREKFRYFD